MKYKKIFLLILLFIIVVFACVRLEFQNDTFYSIKIGEDIFKYGVDFIDHHSFHDLSYSYPHVIFDIGVYYFYHVGGFNALYNLTLFYTFVFSFLLFFVNYKLSKNYVFSLLFTLLSLISLKHFFTLRAQIVSISIFLLQYYFLYNLFLKKKNIHIVSLFLCGILLVNCHVATYPFYLIMFIPFLICSRFRKDIVFCFILCCLCGFISFMGVDSYTYLINTLLNSTTKYISEHQPLILVNTPFILIVLLIDLWLFFNKKFKLELCDVLILFGVIFMTFSSVRHSMFLCLYTILILSKNIGRYVNKNEKNLVNLVEMKIFSLRGFIIILIVVFGISFLSFIVDDDKIFVDEKKYPVDAVKYIKDNIDYKNERIYNDINIGSYLMLNDIPVFIDSRTDLYTYTYNHKKDIFNDYVNVLFFNKYYEDIFSFYDIDYVLMSNKEYIVEYLRRDDKYIVIYADDYYTLFERNVNK